MKLPQSQEFLPQLAAFLATQPRSPRDVAKVLAPYLQALVEPPRGKARKTSPGAAVDLETAVAPILAAARVGDLQSARAVAVSLFLLVLDLAERSVYPDLDPLTGLLLLVFEDPDWRFMLAPVAERMGRVLCRFRLDGSDPEELLLDFFGYEIESRYSKNGRSYLQAIKEALDETGHAGGLLRVHYRYFLSSRLRRALDTDGSLDEFGSGKEDPVQDVIFIEEFERKMRTKRDSDSDSDDGAVGAGV